MTDGGALIKSRDGGTWPFKKNTAVKSLVPILNAEIAATGAIGP